MEDVGVALLGLLAVVVTPCVLVMVVWSWLSGGNGGPGNSDD